MMSAINSTLALIARLALSGRRYGRCTLAALRVRTSAAAVVKRLKNLAPYALIELVLPGGSIMALLLWLYRRQKKIPAFAAHDEVLPLL
jgi:hypothetical protein